MDNAAWSWAEEVFGQAELGDSRRTRRLVHIAAEAAAKPGGRVLEVCRTSASRQGAYDFLSNASIAPAGVQAAVTRAAALGCESEEFCFVVVDGTALTLKDWKRNKDFGSVGSTREGGRGLKVMNAYALASDGTPVGLLGQHWWKRVARKKRRDCQRRIVEDKETKYWLRAIKGADLLLSAVGTRAWFQIDREGDLRHLENLARVGPLVHRALDLRTSLPCRSTAKRASASCGRPMQSSGALHAGSPDQV